MQTKADEQEELKEEEQEGGQEQEQEGAEEQEQESEQEEEGVQEKEGVRVELLDRELWHQFRNSSRSFKCLHYSFNLHLQLKPDV